MHALDTTSGASVKITFFCCSFTQALHMVLKPSTDFESLPQNSAITGQHSLQRRQYRSTSTRLAGAFRKSVCGLKLVIVRLKYFG